MSSIILNNFAQHLVTKNLLDESQILSAIQQAQQKQLPLIIYLAQTHLVNNKLLAQAVAEHFQLPYLDLNTVNLQTLPPHLLDGKVIRKNWLLPLSQNQQQLQIAVVDPTLSIAFDEIKFHTGLFLQPVIVEYEQLARAIEIFLSHQQYPQIKKSTETLIHLSQDDAPVIRFIQQILSDAIHHQASDVHFETFENFYRIRMRVDGILHEVTCPPMELAQRFTARLKVMAKLDIAERRLPQDGRFTFTTEKFSKECRISTCPTLFGEKIVVRILDNNSLALNIDQLGFDAAQKQEFLNAISLPQGMVLVTGPTGSGKTVTLYTALNMLNTLDKNISTVEDPVEINLAGINQVHVNPKIGLTFSNTLRTFLRQDPDILMVGEIRDFETAEIAIKSAQTGHLVLSTIHTNNAAETLTRIINMGIASFNIASSVVLIIAQRLVRCLCNHCKKPYQIPGTALLQQGFKSHELSNLQLFTAHECTNCIKGYKGRIGIFEVMPITETLGRMIMTNINAIEIAQQAKNEGMKTLRESALEKVKQGITSLEEVNRVLGNKS